MGLSSPLISLVALGALAGNLLTGWLSGSPAAVVVESPIAAPATWASGGGSDCDLAQQCLDRLEAATERQHRFDVKVALTVGLGGWTAALVTALCLWRRRPLASAAAVAEPAPTLALAASPGRLVTIPGGELVDEDFASYSPPRR